jgi:hypothetical protein
MGMEAYNERTQPQSMMQLASGGIADLVIKWVALAMPMDTAHYKSTTNAYSFFFSTKYYNESIIKLWTTSN